MALGPRVVGDAEVDAVGYGGMVEEEEYVDGIRLGIDEDLLAEFLERDGAVLAGVGQDAVRDFEAVDVGLIFLEAAEGIQDGGGCETKKRDEQEQGGKRSPIIDSAKRPGIAVTGQKPIDGAIAEV